jgi:predicted dehydrogenase
MKRLRGAVYGCGMISEFHLRGWARIPEVEIVALGKKDPAPASILICGRCWNRSG